MIGILPRYKMPATMNVRYPLLGTCHKMSATVNVRYISYGRLYIKLSGIEMSYT